MKHSTNFDLEKQSEKQFFLLKKGLDFFHLSLSEKQANQFLLYIQLLLEWNQQINLFSKNDVVRLSERHILESVCWMLAFDEIKAPIMDLGSGAGFPGIPISILNPEKKVVLVESKKKKAIFLNNVVDKLDLQTQVLPERVEDLMHADKLQNYFPSIISRAVTNLSTLLKWSQPLLCLKGTLITFKGNSISEEIEKLKQTYSKSLKFDVNIIDYTVVKNLETKPKTEKRKLVKVTLD